MKELDNNSQPEGYTMQKRLKDALTIVVPIIIDVVIDAASKKR
jgi:hypothetical protein